MLGGAHTDALVGSVLFEQNALYILRKDGFWVARLLAEFLAIRTNPKNVDPFCLSFRSSLVLYCLRTYFPLSFSVPINRRNPDMGSSRRLPPPLPNTVRASIFITEKFQLILPSSTRIELRPMQF